MQVLEEDRSIPLHLASRRGHTELVDMLLERGANVNAQEEDESTPLHPVSFRCRWHSVLRTSPHAPRARRRRLRTQQPWADAVVRLASRSRNVEVIRIHLDSERGADATAVRDRGTRSSRLRCIWRCGGDVRRLRACFWSVVRMRWLGIGMG